MAARLDQSSFCSLRRLSHECADRGQRQAIRSKSIDPRSEPLDRDWSWRCRQSESGALAVGELAELIQFVVDGRGGVWFVDDQVDRPAPDQGQPRRSNTRIDI